MNMSADTNGDICFAISSSGEPATAVEMVEIRKILCNICNVPYDETPIMFVRLFGGEYVWWHRKTLRLNPPCVAVENPHGGRSVVSLAAH